MLCHVLLLAVCGLSVLSAVSCRTQKAVERATIRGDTLSLGSTESETLETATEPIAGDTLSLTIPMEAIQNLPDGAVFTKKEGRTRLTVGREGAAVVAKAETDSVGRTVNRYERKARDSLQHRQTAAASETTIREKPPNGYWPLLMLAAFGTIGAIIVIKRLFK